MPLILPINKIYIKKYSKDYSINENIGYTESNGYWKYGNFYHLLKHKKNLTRQ